MSAIEKAAAAHSGDKSAKPCFQYLLRFNTNDAKKEKYNYKKYRALLSKHLHDRAKMVKPLRRNPDASQAEARASGGGTAP